MSGTDGAPLRRPPTPGGPAPDVSVLVVGAGPVGLLLAARLLRLGVPTRIVDRRPAAASGSRAIGVHPPGLAALAGVDAAAAVLDAGVRIVEGVAYGARGPLGSLRFEAATPVLAVPQAATEAALRAALERAGGRVERGTALMGLRSAADGTLHATLLGDAERTLRATVVVGCDGRTSAVRSLAGIGWRGGPYRDRYLMADLPDVTGLGPRAEIRLHRDGLVESFPLPGGWRRVVVRVADAGPGPSADGAAGAGTDGSRPGVDEEVARRVCALAAARGADRFDPAAARMTSAFGVERRLATRFARGRVVLAGDAAHVLSPIGGQGMNLGWLDAVALADALGRGLARGAAAVAAELDAYARRRRGAARVATWRADVNTRLGRPVGPLAASVRDGLLERALRPPFRGRLVGAFTMRGLA